MNLGNLDTATISGLAGTLSQMQPQELIGAVEVLRKRFGIQFALTVSAMAGAIGTPGQAGPAQAIEVAGLDPAGLLTALRTDTLGNLRVGGQFAPGTSAGGPPAVFPVINGAVDFIGLIQTLRSAGPAVSGATSGGLYVVRGNPARRTYWAAGSVNPTTATFDMIVVEAPAGNDVYLRRLWLFQCGSATAAGIRQWALIRTTTAGAGGLLVPPPMDAADGAFGGLVRFNTSAVAGILGTTLLSLGVFIPAAVGAFTPVLLLDWTNDMTKAPRIPQGAANGITLRDLTGGVGAANVWIGLEFESATSGTGAPP